MQRDLDHQKSLNVFKQPQALTTVNQRRNIGYLGRGNESSSSSSSSSSHSSISISSSSSSSSNCGGSSGSSGTSCRRRSDSTPEALLLYKFVSMSQGMQLIQLVYLLLHRVRG